MNIELADDTVVSVCHNIIKTRDVGVEFNPNGLGDQYYKLMLNNSAKIAQIDGITGQAQTYANLLSRCVQTAKAMRLYGTKPGDTVTLCTDNHLDTCVPFIASLFIGAYSAPIDLALSEDEMMDLLKKFEPKILFCSPDAEVVLDSRISFYGIDTRIVVFGNAKYHMSFNDFLKTTPENDSFEVYKARSILDTVYISLTGGSSGNHKAACLHHLSMYNFVNSSFYASENNATVLSFAPMVWLSAPLNICRAITYGYARLIVPKFDPKTFFYLIDKYKIRNIIVSSFVLIQLLKEKVPKDVDATTLKSMKYIGGPVSKSSIEQLRKMLPKTMISTGYGQTEIGGYLTNYDWNLHPEHYKCRSESIGRPMDGITYKVVDIDSGEALGPNKPGHLLVQTIFQMNGYYKSDSSHVWNEEGWLKTGDILYYDEQFFFYFVDRMKEMMRYRSWAVSPIYLESILMKHPSVELAFVTGVPHDQDGDHPIAAVVLKEEANSNAPELERFVNGQVKEARKLRKGVKIVQRDFVPYSAVGKVSRYEFRRKLLKLL